jgi:hypothetical protein
MFVYYCDELAIGKAKLRYQEGETLLSTHLLRPMLMEMFLLTIHPLPVVTDGTFEVTSIFDESGEFHQYSWDGVLGIAVVLRVYLFFRGLHYYLGIQHDLDARTLATMNSVALGPMFTFKDAVKRQPFAVLLVLIVVLTAVCAYALMLAERPQQAAFEHYSNCVWCVLVTMTTVGACTCILYVYVCVCVHKYICMLTCIHISYMVHILNAFS